MNRKGILFDIKQMAVFDGPGIRTTVFLKGCPLRCQWCHNPEGISKKPQLMVAENGCNHCGLCREVCKHPENCTACGACVRVCPAGIRRMAGKWYESGELAKFLLKDREYLEKQQGGVTFSGGEPLYQPDFLFEVVDKLEGLHTAIETAGYCSIAVFKKMLQKMDFVLMDIKIMDSRMHKKYTGVDNRMILQNLEHLKKGQTPFVIRIPLIPGVNDTKENLEQTAERLVHAECLEKVELLPYHKTAGAKYGMLGMEYEPEFDVQGKMMIQNEAVFEKYGIPCTVL